MPTKTTTEKNIWEELRKPFPKGTVGLLPKVTCRDCADKRATCQQHRKAQCPTCKNYVSSAHIHIDFVGHAAVTDRLDTVVGPNDWNWEPMSFTDEGTPRLDRAGNLWIYLTIHGVKKPGVGDGSTSAKELIGDAIRNAAMRFGVARDLWTKEELESHIEAPENKNEKPTDSLPSRQPEQAPAAPSARAPIPISPAPQAAPGQTQEPLPTPPPEEPVVVPVEPETEYQGEPSQYITTVQAQLLLRAAAKATGYTERSDIIAWFESEVGIPLPQVKRTDHKDILDFINGWNAPA